MMKRLRFILKLVRGGPPQAHRPRAARPSLESLEDRSLPSAATPGPAPSPPPPAPSGGPTPGLVPIVTGPVSDIAATAVSTPPGTPAPTDLGFPTLQVALDNLINVEYRIAWGFFYGSSTPQQDRSDYFTALSQYEQSVHFYGPFLPVEPILG